MKAKAKDGTNRGRERGSRNLATKSAAEIMRYFDFDPLNKLIQEYQELEGNTDAGARRDRIKVVQELMKYRHPSLSSNTHKGVDDSPLSVTINYGDTGKPR